MNRSINAPIVAFVYNRPDKTKDMIDSLGACSLAAESELIIYCDGPAKESAIEKVEETREYIDTIPSLGYFKKVIIHKAETNKGLAASVISGITDVINEYGRVICVEDDLLFSNEFLTYMNKCLDYYEDDSRIWSVSGYSPAINSGSYDKDVYLGYRASSWGWGTWKDRWDSVDWKVSDYRSFRFDPIENIRFSYGGNDLPSMLRAQIKGKIDSWAVRFVYAQNRKRMYSVSPVVSLVLNNGLDGTGTNSKKEDSTRYAAVLNGKPDKEYCYDDLKPDRHITWEFYKKYHLSLWIRIRDKVIEKMR